MAVVGSWRPLLARPTRQTIRQLLRLELLVKLNRSLLRSEQVRGVKWMDGLLLWFGPDNYMSNPLMGTAVHVEF